MWQIVSNNSYNNDLTTEKNKIVKKNTIQICSWKYGIITISDWQSEKHSLTQTQIMITTQPFDKQYQGIQKKERIIIIESGEQNKTIETVDEICRQFQQKGVNKQSTVYIKGGGMLLDMCGFACAIYMRGVAQVVYIPTTLLAIVDATVGGKTGINWGGAKNILGVIRHPSQIRISLHYLQSLTDRDISNGLAEIIKMSLTHDKNLFNILQNKQVTIEKLRSSPSLLRQIIKRSLQIKIKVVQNDQHDHNQRKFLNFGHTIGHAIELSQSGKKFMHGQCVSIGILQIIKLGKMLLLINNTNMQKRIQKVFKKFNLPTKLPQNFDTVQIIQLMRKDKKNLSLQHVEVVLIEDIGYRKQRTTSISIEDLYKYFSKNICIKTGVINQLSIKIEQINNEWKKNNKFPSSKSLSIRYLFLVTLHFLKYRQSIQVNNFLQSDDTQYLKQSLQSLGFIFDENQSQHSIKVVGFQKKNKAQLNVGNSGLTARFILPLCAHLEGEWTIQCQHRMSQRPNQQIFQFCRQHYNCSFEWMNNLENSFPVKIRTQGKNKPTVKKQIINLISQQSSQFISSALMNSYLWTNKDDNQEIIIKVPAGKLVSQSYITMTVQCLEKFGIQVSGSNNNAQNNISMWKIRSVKRDKMTKEVSIQGDLSSFSYPYALCLINKANLPKIPEKSSQGDLQFYQYCQSIIDGTLPQHLQFSQCTDTFMTMAAILATNSSNNLKLKSSNVQIHGIANQRVKQSNRIQLIKNNLQKIGCILTQTQDGLIIPANFNYRQFKDGQIIVFQTAGDHRLTMSMAILASNLSQKFTNIYFVIDDKNAVTKTFPTFWKYLQEVGIHVYIQFTDRQVTAIKQKYKTHLNDKVVQPQKQKQYHKKVRKILIIGNRGAGKSSIANALCKNTNSLLIDIDKQITNTIISERFSTTSPITSISEYVEQFGWEQFRKLQYNQLNKFINSSLEESTNQHKYDNIIIAVGGGVVDWQQSMKCLKNAKNMVKIYIQKQFENLKIQLNGNRPHIPNFEEVVKVRSKKYEEVADYIISIPYSAHLKLKNKTNFDANQYKQINQYIINEYNLVLGNIQHPSNITNMCTLKPGYIYCISELYNKPSNKIIQLASQQQFMKVTQNGLYGENNKNKDINSAVRKELSGFELRVDLIVQEQLLMNKTIEVINQEELIKKCRYAISQFKMQNQLLLNAVPIILTLRTKLEFGTYPFINCSIKNNTNLELEGYFKWLKSLQKIPASYIDYQFNYYQYALKSSKISNISSDKKYIYSYHGNSLKTINQLLALRNKLNSEKYQRRDLIKLCYNGSHQIWSKNRQIWKKSSDICINLRDPFSRLENKYQMIIRQNDPKRLIDIPTRIQLEMLMGLKRFFK